MQFSPLARHCLAKGFSTYFHGLEPGNHPQDRTPPGLLFPGFVPFARFTSRSSSHGAGAGLPFTPPWPALRPIIVLVRGWTLLNGFLTIHRQTVGSDKVIIIYYSICYYIYLRGHDALMCCRRAPLPLRLGVCAHRQPAPPSLSRPRRFHRKTQSAWG
jgi:hypothetical protein